MRSKSKPVSQRQLRVGEQIRRIVAEAFQKGDVPEELLDAPLFSVMQAKVSSDFSYCKIYVAPLDAQNVAMAELVKTLNESRRYFRGVLAKAMRLRVAPAVRFYADETQEVAAHIDELLNSPQVKRDLEETPDDDGRA